MEIQFIIFRPLPEIIYYQIIIYYEEPLYISIY